MTSKARTNGRTAEQHVWYWLRRQQDPQPSRAIAEHFNVPMSAMIATLRRLMAKKSVTISGRTYAAVYRATKIAPEDYRGISVGTISALSRQWRASTVRRCKRIPIPEPTHPLDAAWRSL